MLTYTYIYIYICIYIYDSAFCVPSPPPSRPMVSPPTPPPMVCFKSANSHRDGAPRGRHPRNCRRFWRLNASILVSVVIFGPSGIHRVSKVPAVTGIGAVLIAIFISVANFGPSCFCRTQKFPTSYCFCVSKMLTVTGIRVVLIVYKPSTNHKFAVMFSRLL